MPQVLEIPLKEGGGSVNVMQVAPGRLVLRSRADYENLWKHLSSYRQQNQFETEEAYQEWMGKNYFGHFPGWTGDWSKMGYGSHPYWWGEGATPQYEGKSLQPLSKQLLDPKQIDETITFATKGTYNKLSQNQAVTEKEAEIRLQELEKAGLDKETKQNLTAKAKPHHELEAKFFEDPRYLFTSDSNGVVRQTSLRQGEVVVDFGNKFHNKTIYAMASTRNSKFFFTGDELGNFRQISVVDGETVKDYQKIFKATITSMTCSPDSRYVLVGKHFFSNNNR